MAESKTLNEVLKALNKKFNDNVAVNGLCACLFP